MALFGKRAGQPVAQETAVSKPSGTVIAEGMTFVGDFETEEHLDIQGVIQGEVNSSVDAHVAETGKHIGKMHVNNLYVDGKLESDVVCAQLTSLSDTANFKGTLDTATFDAAHGSTFDGVLKLQERKLAEPVQTPDVADVAKAEVTEETEETEDAEEA